MKVKVWLHIYNCGDGSCVVKFFPTEAEAEAYAAKNDERFCEDVYEKELEFSPEGVLLTKNPW
jgi:hypothetical protein